MANQNSGGIITILTPQNQPNSVTAQASNQQSNFPLYPTQQSISQPSYSGVPTMPQPISRNPIYYGEIIQCGVSFSDAQRINYQMHMNNLELWKEREKCSIRLQYEWELQRVKDQSMEKQKALLQATPVIGNDTEPLSPGGRTFNIKQLVERFIEMKSLVKIKGTEFRNGRRFFIRDDELNRHKSIEEKDLKVELNEFIFSTVDIEYDIPQKNLDRAWCYLQFATPFLQKSTLRKIPDSQIVFLDGIYDLRTGKFTPFSDEKIFNDFSIPMKWTATNDTPRAFEALLYDIFSGDQNEMTLLYEFIGAMLSPVPLIKKIYIFQGVSQAGKSRLARIICNLFAEEDVKFLDKLSDITQESVEKNLNNFRVIYIDEAPNKKILPSQASTLKTIANGCRCAKILISTNHALYTDNNRFVEQALMNRFATLPFYAPMKNANPYVSSFEEMYLQNEKPAIIKKALQFFQRIFDRGDFTYNFPVNTVVSNEGSPDTDSECLKSYCIDNYEIVPETSQGMTMKFIAQDINQKFPGMIKNNAVLGKKLVEIYGEKLKPQHLSSGMVYNLRKISSACVHA